MSNQPHPGPGWQGSYPPPPNTAPQPPRRNTDRIALIIGAIIVGIALIGAAIYLLTRSGNDTPNPTTPASTSTPAQTPGTTTPPGEPEEFTYDDAPPEVSGWIAQPVLEGMLGTYYTKDGVIDGSGLKAQIQVVNYDIDFDLALTSISDTISSSDGRVVCGLDQFDELACFAQTGRFGVLALSTYDNEVVTIQDMVAIGDAIVAMYP